MASPQLQGDPMNSLRMHHHHVVPSHNASGMLSSFGAAGTSSPGDPSQQQRCKRRLHLGQLAYMLPAQSSAPAQPPQTAMPTAVAKRNERERKRVRMVNNGFTTLRQHVPNGAKNKKLSKVETLRSAIEYIKQLQQMLGDYEMPPGLEEALLMQQESEQSSSADENSFPMASTPSYSPDYSAPQYQHHQHQPQLQLHQHHPQMQQHHLSAYSPVPSAGCSAVSSPTPSLGSDGQSPADQFSSGDEDLLCGLTTWFT